MKQWMKRPTALLLVLLLLLGMTACAAPRESVSTAPDETGAAPEQTEAPENADTPETSEPVVTAPLDGVLASAACPELPEPPDEAAFWEAVNALWSQEDLTDEERAEQDQALWDDYSAKSDAYQEALKALRGEPVKNQAGFSAFTEKVAAQLLTGTEKNCVLSPANLYLALAMLAETAAGDTRSQLLSLLGADDAEALRTLAGRVWENLYLNKENSKTLLANSIWLNDGLSFHQGPLDILGADYYASAYQVSMGTEAADKALQDWLNENTGNLLEDSVQDVKTSPETILMLASTLYFKGAWRDEFQEAGTAPDEFTMADGTAVTTDFMHRTQEQSAAVCDGYAVAALPFAEQGSMVFVLPDEGVTLDEALAGGALEDALLLQDRNTTVYDVEWSVPKFDVSSALELMDALQALGVTDAFTPGLADFSPLIADQERLLPYVSSVAHAARVLVDEEGCEAAAYTVIKEEAAAEIVPGELPVLEMNLNRPFLFMITGLDGLPLFIGTVQTPAG